MINDFFNFLRSFLKKYFFSALYLNIPRGIAILVQLVTLPIVLANLPIRDYGLFQFILAVQVWLNLFTANQMTGSSKRGIARGLDGTFLFVFFSRLKLFVFVAIIGIVITFFLYKAGFVTLSLLFILMTVFLIIGFLPQMSARQFFFAKKQFNHFAICESITLSTAAIMGMLAALLTHNILIFTATQFGIIAIFSLAIFFYIVIKNNLISAYKQGAIDKKVFSYGVKMVPAKFALTSGNKAPEFIIALFLGVEKLAVFSIAAKLEIVLRNFLASTHNLFYADFTKMDWSQMITKVNTKLKKGLILASFIVSFFILLGYAYIALFLPESYQMAKVYLLILGLGLPPLALQGIIQAILDVNFRYKELTVLFTLSGLIKISLIVLLGFLFGVIGICWGIVLGNWINLGFYYFLTLRRDLLLKLINKFPLLKKLSNF